MTRTAVVILNYNGSKLLQRFLPSVLSHSGDARVWVADNGSTDNSLQVLRESFPQVGRIELTVNTGFCGGYNQALKQIDAEYYILLNSDVEVTAGWLAPLVELLDKNPDIASAQPKILAEKNRSHFEYAGAGGGLIDTLGYPFCRGRLFYQLEEDLGQYNDVTDIFWASGACMAIRSKLFHQLGGFDEDFFAHMEEIDLCWRLQREGYRIGYAGTSAVYHVGGGTLSVKNPRKTYLNFRNGLSLICKNLPRHELMWKLPVRIGLDWVAAITFALAGSWRDGVAVFKAHGHLLAGIAREFRRRRRYKGSGYRVPKARYPHWIVAQFFLFGRKKYSDLRS